VFWVVGFFAMCEFTQHSFSSSSIRKVLDLIASVS
jgi:hypothetical protein